MRQPPSSNIEVHFSGSREPFERVCLLQYARGFFEEAALSRISFFINTPHFEHYWSLSLSIMEALYFLSEITN